jgi:hypothetical protein
MAEKYYRGSGWKEDSWLPYKLIKGELGIDAVSEEEALRVIDILNERA